MNLVEELVKKYNGTFSEETKKSSLFMSGKYSFHPQNGVLEIDGTKITVSINAVTGASPIAEPYRLVLYLDRDYKVSLQIYPKKGLKRIWHLLTSKKEKSLPEEIDKQFSFRGEQRIITGLGANKAFCELLDGKYTYIQISKKHPKCVVLTPAHGIDGLDHFEKLLQILKHIEAAIKSTQ